MKTKKYLEISNKEYRQMEGISASDLKAMSKSFAYYHYKKENPENSDGPALLFGRASHKMILEPYDFNNEFIVSPNYNRRTKDGREAYEKFIAESNGKDVITQETYEQVVAMRDALYSTQFAKKLIFGEHEKSFFWEEDGLKMKCRPDSFGKIGNQHIIVDYKTTKNAESDAFMRDAIKLGYDIQASHYLKGMKEAYGEDFIFIFIAQEKEPPYSVNILQADDFFIRIGEETRQSLLEDYKECVRRNEWKGLMGFPDEIKIGSLSVPEWQKRFLNESE